MAPVDRALAAEPGRRKVLIATSILLDSRTVYGPAELDPQAILLEPENRAKLLPSMLRLALAQKLPTGFRGNIVVESSGEHSGTFDIKHGGLLAVVDIARFAALKAGANVTGRSGGCGRRPSSGRSSPHMPGRSRRPTTSSLRSGSSTRFSSSSGETSQMTMSTRSSFQNSRGAICAMHSARSPLCRSRCRAGAFGQLDPPSPALMARARIELATYMENGWAEPRGHGPPNRQPDRRPADRDLHRTLRGCERAQRGVIEAEMSQSNASTLIPRLRGSRSSEGERARSPSRIFIRG